MPTFQLNKIVRDKFQKIYDELGQTIKFRRLTDDEWINYHRKDPVKYQEVTQTADERDESSSKPQLPLGRYRHYKGGEYEVVMLACNETTLEWLVVYKPLYENDGSRLLGANLHGIYRRN